MNPIRRKNSIFLLCTLVVLCYTDSGRAKSCHMDSTAEIAWPNRPSHTELQALEQRLAPFLKERVLHRQRKRSPAVSSAVPSESDLILLSKTWNSLSPEFKSLYKQATQLPDSFSSYESPGGHFEILYTLDGDDRVNPEDRYGFSTSDWRLRTGGPNGIPDYIDETAFALDSTWSMEIDRFHFLPPPSFKDDHFTSDCYKVVVETQLDGYYGLTYLKEQISGERGYKSTISLRNDWSGPEWSGLGYDVFPISGMQVTCAHEFFHAIQYAMTWHVIDDIWLDNFPLSWTEGTAVTMEELAFDSVNDYHQYARTYFDHPGVSFFDRSTNDLVYTNAILLLYIFHHPHQGKGIDFIRTMHFTNYLGKIPFHDNLREASQNIGTQWGTLLHEFHTASFYTGTRADTQQFIPDAASFRMKTLQETHLPALVTEMLYINSADQILLIPSKQQTDTLTIQFKGDVKVTDGYPGTNWNVSVLRRKNGTDSLIALPIDKQGKGSLVLSGWSVLDRATIIVTNADPVIYTRNYTIATNVDSIVPSPAIDLYPNPLSLRTHDGTAYISGEDIADIAIYSVNGSLVWRLPPRDDPILPGKRRYSIPCRNSSGSRLVPGPYAVVITRDAASALKPSRSRRTLLITP